MGKHTLYVKINNEHCFFDDAHFSSDGRVYACGDFLSCPIQHVYEIPMRDIDGNVVRIEYGITNGKHEPIKIPDTIEAKQQRRRIIRSLESFVYMVLIWLLYIDAFYVGILAPAVMPQELKFDEDIRPMIYTIAASIIVFVLTIMLIYGLGRKLWSIAITDAAVVAALLFMATTDAPARLIVLIIIIHCIPLIFTEYTIRKYRHEYLEIIRKIRSTIRNFPR